MSVEYMHAYLNSLALPKVLCCRKVQMHDEDGGLCCKAWGYLHHRLGHGGKLGLTLRFSSRWYLCAQKSPYALHPSSEKFPQFRCLGTS